MTNKKQRQLWRERKQDSLARKTLLGLVEVRGVWLPRELHQQVKEQARRLAEQAERRNNERPRAKGASHG